MSPIVHLPLRPAPRKAISDAALPAADSCFCSCTTPGKPGTRDGLEPTSLNRQGAKIAKFFLERAARFGSNHGSVSALIHEFRS